MRFQKHLKKHSTKYIAAIIILISGIAFIWASCLFKTNYFNQVYQDTLSKYATFMAGTLGIVLSAANVWFLLYIWREQKGEFDKQEVTQNLKYEHQRIEERFFNLLEMRKEMRDEIVYKTPNGFSMKSNEAIHEIAAAFSIETQKKANEEKIRKLYEYHGKYLRHYFDLILHILEYIDKPNGLTREQKNEYITVLKASTSYDETLIWHMMRYDYNVKERDSKDDVGIRFMELSRQDMKFDKFDREYGLSDGKVMRRDLE